MRPNGSCNGSGPHRIHPASKSRTVTPGSLKGRRGTEAAPSLLNRLMGSLGSLALRRFGMPLAPLGFNGCRLAVARGDQFLLKLRLFVGCPHFAVRRWIF